MARNIVIVLICSVVVFGVVWKVAPDILTTALPLVGVHVEDATAEAVVPEEPVKPTVTRKSKTRVHKTEAIAPVAAEAPETIRQRDNSTVEVTPEPAPVSVDPSKPRVAAESAALYSSNGPTGRVVKMLKRNDVFELYFTVDNGGQEWMFVNVPDQRVSGFLSTDSVQ